MVIVGWSGWVWVKGTDRQEEILSPWEEKGKGRTMRELGMQRACVGAGWRRWDHYEGAWVRVALQDHVKSVA